MSETLRIEAQVRIDAPPGRVFDSLVNHVGAWFIAPGATAGMGLKIEPWAGGRFFRDLGGEGSHLWGFVQVIRPPRLLEITGPLFVSAPSHSHLTFRLEPDGNETLLKFCHRALGHIPNEVLSGASEGWNHFLKGLKSHAERHSG